MHLPAPINISFTGVLGSPLLFKNKEHIPTLFDLTLFLSHVKINSCSPFTAFMSGLSFWKSPSIVICSGKEKFLQPSEEYVEKSWYDFLPLIVVRAWNTITSWAFLDIETAWDGKKALSVMELETKGFKSPHSSPSLEKVVIIEKRSSEPLERNIKYPPLEVVII